MNFLRICQAEHIPKGNGSYIQKTEVHPPTGRVQFIVSAVTSGQDPRGTCLLARPSPRPRSLTEGLTEMMTFSRFTVTHGRVNSPGFSRNLYLSEGPVDEKPVCSLILLRVHTIGKEGDVWK